MSEQQQRKGMLYTFATIGAHTERDGSPHVGTCEPVSKAQIKRASERA